MKCSTCATPIEKSIYFALEHDAHDIMRVHGGYVYFWAAESCYGETFVKIGYTSNLDQRLAAFSRPAPGVIVPETVDIQEGSLYGVMSGGRRMEKALHEAFAKERTVGEWFLLSERIGYVIDVLLDQWCADPCCSDATHLERRAGDIAMREAMDGMWGSMFGTLQAGIDAHDEYEERATA